MEQKCHKRTYSKSTTKSEWFQSRDELSEDSTGGHYFEPGNPASDPSVCGSLGALFSL